MEIRIYIDNEWNAAEFAAFFQSIDDLHNFLALNYEYDFLIDRVYAFGTRYPLIDARFRLSVSRVQFGSPGFTDFAGIAAAMREIRELIQFLITHWSKRKDRKIEREKREFEVAKLKIEMLEKFMEFQNAHGSRIPIGAERHFGLERNAFPNMDALIEAIIDERLIGVDNDDEDEKE